MSSRWSAPIGVARREQGYGADPTAEFMMFGIRDPGERWFRRLRVLGGVGAVALGAVWSDSIGIRVGLGVVLAAVLSLSDALYSKSAVAFTGLSRDAVLMLAALVAVAPPLWSLLGPWALLVAVGFLRLPLAKAVRFVAAVSTGGVALAVYLAVRGPGGREGPATLILGGSLALLGLAGVFGIVAHHARERHRARKGSMEHALETCSESMLGGRGTIDDAIAALLPATGARSVVVRRNVDDFRLGSSMRLVAEVHVTDPDHDGNRQRELVPWAWFDEKRHILAHGRECVIRRDALTGPARQLYDEAGVLLELDVPIFVHGAWAGHVAFTELERRRMDDVQERSMLKAVAYLIGEYWERQADRARYA